MNKLEIKISDHSKIIMQVILISIGIINLTYLTIHLLRAKVASNPKQLQSIPTRDSDLAPVEYPEQRLAGSIAPPETLKIPQLPQSSKAWNYYATQESQQGSDEKITLTSPIAVPSNLGMELPEFSLSYPVRELRATADADRISDIRPSPPHTVAMAPAEKRGAPAVGLPEFSLSGIERELPPTANAVLNSDSSFNNSLARPSPPLTIPIGTPEKQGEPAVAVPVAYPQHKNPPSQGSAKDLLPLADAAGLQELVQKNQIVVGLGIGQDSGPVDYADVEEIRRLQQQLEGIEQARAGDSNEGRSPGLTIAIPSGFGADNNTLYTAASFQERVRGSDSNDGSLGLGIGLGDAIKSVGVELSYTLASFGNNSRDFGSGAFNVKVHRRLSEDFAIAGGVNGLINLGDENGFENRFYGVATKIFRTHDDINKPLSRIAVTAGLGNGQFRTEEGLSDDENDINVFGNVAFRVARPVSIITEWSGQDLGVGFSIAPFENIPLVITPALRDLAGSGDRPRFVLGGGFVYQF